MREKEERRQPIREGVESQIIEEKISSSHMCFNNPEGTPREEWTVRAIRINTVWTQAVTVFITKSCSQPVYKLEKTGVAKVLCGRKK